MFFNATEARVPAESQRSMALDTTSVTGNRELPKVLYIVPWQGATAGKVTGRPVNSLIDEVLSPIDRDTFSRELRYFAQLEGEVDSARDVESEE